MSKVNQKDIILEILREKGEARTEEVKIAGMYKGVSCADRYLRWLQEDGKIKNIGKKTKGDKTDTWKYIPENKVLQTSIFQ